MTPYPNFAISTKSSISALDRYPPGWVCSALKIGVEDSDGFKGVHDLGFAFEQDGEDFESQGAVEELAGAIALGEGGFQIWCGLSEYNE